MPGKKWKRSIRRPKQYKALRQKRHMSKRKAARIANAPRRRRRRR